MPLVVGFVLSVCVAIFARRVGFDRDRAFYATILIIVATYNVLFAVMSGSAHTLLLELIITSVFAVAAVAGFKSSTWIIVVGLAGHGALDFVHGRLVDNTGVPVWWPPFCAAYDIGAAICLAWLIRRRPGAGADLAPGGIVA